VLHEFDGTGGCDPTGGVIVDGTGIINGIPGTLYGTAPYCGAAGVGAVWSLTPPATAAGKWHFEILHDFESGDDGANPLTGLLLDKTGHLFGTTNSVAGCPYTCGSVFRLDPPKNPGDKWTIHNLARLQFPTSAATVDYRPNSALVFDPHGNLLGTADGLSGAVYEVFRGGSVQIRYSPDFSNTGNTVGYHPQGVVIDASGLIYGTAFDGGDAGVGTLFQLAGAKSNKVLFSFDGPHGASPLTGPTLDLSGNLYGTTWRGGNPTDCPNSPGCGTVWKRLPNSKVARVLHSFAFFTRPKDGQTPMSPLVRDAKTDTFYGTTLYGGIGTQCGGDNGACGTVFQVDADGAYELLWDFPRGGPAAPEGLLVFFDGALYGTSYDGGKQCGGGHYIGCGTVWKLTP
jgi:hypothetical protein